MGLNFLSKNELAVKGNSCPSINEIWSRCSFQFSPACSGISKVKEIKGLCGDVSRHGGTQIILKIDVPPVTGRKRAISGRKITHLWGTFFNKKGRLLYSFYLCHLLPGIATLVILGRIIDGKKTLLARTIQ